jgi:predicted O-methyltransferase YrrM
MNKKEVLKALNFTDAFEGFKPLEDAKLTGWNGDSPLLPMLVAEVKPKLIVEVGSWMGQSSINLAKAIKSLNLDCTLICVDTWLGSIEHWQDPNIKPMLNLKHGRPDFYDTFLSNVKAAGVDDVVVPVSMPSLVAANYLKGAKLNADLIHLDGSNEQFDVFHDLVNYWDLLNPGGMCFSDDWNWTQVQEAIKAFCAQTGTPVINQNIHWMIRKR